MGMATLVWFRSDLRISDNPALSAAIERGGRVIGLHVIETDSGLRASGAARRWWLHRSLGALSESLAGLGIPLATVAGDAEACIFSSLRSHSADALFWNRRYAPAARAIDAGVLARCRREGVIARDFAGDVLVEPSEILTGQGRPYSVYTPFWKVLRTRRIPAPVPAPGRVAPPIAPEPVDRGYRAPRWARKLEACWSAGETAAQAALREFLEGPLPEYPTGRDFPGRPVTSGLSPHLAFGEISPRQVWHAALHAAQRTERDAQAVDRFLGELAWRDFNYHQLYHREDIAQVPMQEKFSRMRWRRAPGEFEAWTRGRTGIPIVDAGMRELWETGTMHNRIRMIAASLLAKNLLLDWRLGERWFWETLLDADPANNPGNWQWVAGCGQDAAPFFRIFNPVTQGERFDANGTYVRRWVPEIAALPDKWLHKPAEAPRHTLDEAGVILGETYPRAIVDLKSSRQRALAALAQLQSGRL
jgi:deoxyribodipyrimidine photo-lyase